MSLLQLDAATVGGYLPGAYQEEQPGKVGNYVPTLFSMANYQVSCEGAAGRALKYQALNAGQVLYWEGILLLLISAVVSLLKVGGLCLDGVQASHKVVGKAPPTF